ncbi:Rv3235 family protein [Kribbella solani]|uniref:Uncharacterized protein n=1 Tax=Kribbella solani TaxID=236067 RepID=A0A841DUK2_9ACTN|nr:Rv3235 family protein [Kribbella solani]MBB5980446.1 hypothetical protein [Kribbella solani]
MSRNLRADDLQHDGTTNQTNRTDQASPTSPTSPTKENLMRSNAAPDDHADSPVDDLTPDETVPRTAAGAIRAVDPPGSSAGDGAAGTAAGRYGGELTEEALTSRLEVVRRLGIGPADAAQARASRPPRSRVGKGAQPQGTGEVVADGSTTGTEQVAGTRPAARTGQFAGAGQLAGVGQAVRTGGGAGGLQVRVPAARVWGARLAQAVSEVLAGDRPISQLVRFVDESVFADVNRRVRLLGMTSTAGSRSAKEKSTVRSVRVFMPEPTIAEVAAHVRHGERSRAIALRMEVRRNRWVCTALELG